MALQVLCSSYELEESGDVVALGDHIVRHVGRRISAYYGSELDSIEWNFDSEAAADGSTATTIPGDVELPGSLAFVASPPSQRSSSDSRMVPARDGFHLLAAPTSKVSSRPLTPARSNLRSIWGPVSTPDTQSHAYSAGYPRTEEGDEHHSGWLVTREPFSVHAPPSCA